LLIDADNLPTAQVEEALEKLEEVSSPIIRKAFGDFTNSAKNWSAEFLRKFGITPIQHFPVSNYKNGADIAMCIAAMDVLHTHTVDAIVLFSSDSDFSSLASRIREAGIEVIGIGDRQTSEVFRACFDKFIVLDRTTKTSTQISQSGTETAKVVEAPVIHKLKPDKQKKTVAKKLPQIPPHIRTEIRLAVEKLTVSDEPVLLAQVNARVKERIPGFDCKKYKFTSLSKLMISMNELELVNNNRQVRLISLTPKGKP